MSLRDFRADSVRGNPIFCQFPNGGGDWVSVPRGFSDFHDALLHLYPKTGVDSSKLYYSYEAGTNAGTGKIKIYYPDSSTLVETFDNVPGTTYVQGSLTSSYVVFTGWGATLNWTTEPAVLPGLIGDAKRQGVISVVSTLSPLGVKYYEGPKNEPNLSLSKGLGMAEETRLFADAVHTADPAAIVMGPTQVSLDLSNWANGFALGGGPGYLDELAMHAYNSDQGGDHNYLRNKLGQYVTDLTTLGLQNMTRWITESTNVFCSVYGVYHPRRSRWIPLNLLIWEEYGVPRERNLVWYDLSHGFWSYPSFLEHSNGSLVPYTAMCRVLSEETFEKTFHHRIDFGGLPHANAMVMGQVYTSPLDDTSTAVFMLGGYMDNSPSVTLNVEGTTQSSLTYVDAFGNTATASVSSSRATIPLAETPTYVRLPAGTHVSVYAVNDWGHSPPQNIAPLGAMTIRSSRTSLATDLDWTIDVFDSDGVPSTATLMFSELVDVDRIIVSAGVCWQIRGSLADFDVQTTTDGTNWTTRKTITKDVSSFRFGTGSDDAGCTFETYWDEQRDFDIALGATYSCTGVRLYVRQTSYGGEPDAQAISAGGQGYHDQRINLRQVVVPSATVPATLTDTYLNTVVSKSPVGYWRCSETVGSTTLVSQVNAPTVNATYIAGTLGVNGPIADGATAASLASQRLASVANNAVLNVGDVFSINLWAKTTATIAGDNFIFDRGGNNSPEIDFIHGWPSLVDHNTNKLISQSNVSGADGAWHMWTFTKNGSTAKVYRDGVDATSSSPSQLNGRTFANFTFSNSGASTLTLGGSNSDGFNGSAGEFALFAVELSPADVSALYASASTPGGTPATTIAPATSGSSSVGGQVVTSQGAWSGKPVKYTYQWQKSADGSTGWTDITGATYHSYVIQSGDAFLRCNVTAINVVGNTTTATSDVVTVM